MKKEREKRLLHLLRCMAGVTEHGVTANTAYQARFLRNTAREAICEIFPNSEAAADVEEWRKTSPDWPNPT